MEGKITEGKCGEVRGDYHRSRLRTTGIGDWRQVGKIDKIPQQERASMVARG
ncbi:hypothetical protein QG37_00652 [Candidozyma auris]|uniref:Uncharacterized protein n=1 Tax=Candidozyma auris TaxID=498019 RepID=A0A0L0P7T6_CANAR|nr:hypothetical protein QG37_00652 [[Candida] auris]